jgi:hypothetical protein
VRIVQKCGRNHATLKHHTAAASKSHLRRTHSFAKQNRQLEAETPQFHFHPQRRSRLRHFPSVVATESLLFLRMLMR